MSKSMIPSEGTEQATLFSWARMQEWRYPELKLMFHIPNGGKRSSTEAARFKAEGVKSGVSDIFLPVPRDCYHGLWIEMKRLKDSAPSTEQKQWLTGMRAQGYAAEICYGWIAAKEIIEDYMKECYREVWQMGYTRRQMKTGTLLDEL